MTIRASIRKGLAERLDTIADLRGGYAYVPRQINPPLAIVIGLDKQPHTFGKPFSLYEWEATVRILASGDIGYVQERLDDLADQVESAIDGDPTLGGAVDDATWMRTRGDSEGLLEIQGVTLYALDCEVRIQG